MSRINILSFEVANLIAAGEVVDRPASVIKELTENAIDSGADRITIEIQNGGVTFMRVSDNGCGIEPDDLPTAVRRHATSKIKDAQDLDGILTLGFRGEALAAIAAVSDLRIISRQKGALTGAAIEVSGGVIEGVRERGASEGTTVIAENLFFNVPARRKFLKRDVTEAAAVSAVIEKIALSHPEIAFSFISDGVAKIDTAGDGKLLSVIYSLYGRDFARGLLQVGYEHEGVTVSGYVGRSDNVKPNRSGQSFFINGRYIRSKTATAALEQAFASYIPQEKFPVCVLNIEISPRAVDVNVHPAKLEVKFSNEKPVFEAIYYGVKNTLEKNVTRPDIKPEKFSGMTYEEYRRMFAPGTAAAATEGKNVTAVRSKTPEKAEQQRLSGIATIKTAAETARDNQHSISAERAEGHTEEKTSRGTVLQAVLSAASYIEEFGGTASTGEAHSTQQYPDDDIDTDIPVCSQNEVTAPAESGASNESSAGGDTGAGDAPGFAGSAASGKNYSYDGARTAETPSAGGMAVNDLKTEPAHPDMRIAPPYYRIIGEGFNSYVIVELGEKLLFVDKHAAHERILFEKLKAGLRDIKISSQLLIVPIEFMLTSDEVLMICEYREEIEKTGFSFTAEKYTIYVSAVPEGIPQATVPDIFMTIADRIRNQTGTAELEREKTFEKALYSASCKAAIKAGREYGPEHIKWLIGMLMELPDITVCPHGRPVAMEIDKSTFDRQFGRT